MKYFHNLVNKNSKLLGCSGFCRQIDIQGLGLSRFFLVFGFFVFLVSCSNTSSYQSRLNHFYGLLDTNAKTAFEKGEIEKVADYLKNKQSQSDFKKEYEELKKREAINLFNDKQTVMFFYKYFYQKNQK